MKRLFFFIISIFISINIFAIDLRGKVFSSNDPEMGDYDFKGDTFIHTYYLSDGKNISSVDKEYRYRIVYKSKVPFIQYGDEYEKEYLVLGNGELIFLYNKDNESPAFIGVEGEPDEIGSIKNWSWVGRV